MMSTITPLKYQEQLFADVLQNRCSQNLANFTRKHLCVEINLKKTSSRCFPEKFTKFL